ncbi:hypothetical protein LCM10_09665 [Rossellomorea aquimaris]|uniref:hypothetical protein n=1 Tax=Rossellomorea aquimaris TaxID=189382 RepID=UPI001CD43FE3|nr:hypothetical protein [Rossellomorea aquimaris]MCA1055250.1 hypothetical protein [Rossellomorea aquimaris]
MLKKAFHEGKLLKVVVGLAGLMLISGVTIYSLSHIEKGKAEQIMADAEAEVASVYGNMQSLMENAKVDGMLATINDGDLESAQLSMNSAEVSQLELSGGSQSPLQQELNAKIGGIEEYNRLVPAANRLQSQINDLTEKVERDPLAPVVSNQLVALEEELSDFTKQVSSSEHLFIKDFFSDRYQPQVEIVKKNLALYREAFNQVTELKTLAEKLSVPQDEFNEKASELSATVKQLPYSNGNKKLQEDIQLASREYEKNKLALEEKKGEEEKRLAAERKKAEEQKVREAEEEAFPMQFVETSSDGFQTTFSRKPYGERYEEIDEIARKHGGRYYYVPSSDVSVIFAEGRKPLAFLNYGFSASVKNKELFIDLYVHYTGVNREEASELVSNVINTGEPVETGDGGEASSKLWIENNKLHYDAW